MAATHTKRIRCLDKYEIRESYFEGILSFFLEIIFLSSNLLVRKQKLSYARFSFTSNNF